MKPLSLSAGADQQAALTTLETIRLIARHMGVSMTLGRSNVSFRLPKRADVNDVFLVLAIEAGVTCPIVNPKRGPKPILMMNLLLGRDQLAMRYIPNRRQGG